MQDADLVRIPPHDLDAEAAVLSACLLDPSLRPPLQAHHFYAPAHALTWQAYTELADSGRPVDLVTLANLLRERQQIQAVGGTPFLAHLIDATPAVANVAEHAAIVRRLHLQRRAIHLLHQRTNDAYQGELGEVLNALHEDVSGLRQEHASGGGWAVLDAAAIMAPLPPVPWVCQALELASGAPSMWAGYGYSKKTLAAQSLALSVATGLPVWGRFPCASGSVLHIDYEQGERLTRDRYQRLMRGMGIDPERLAGRLFLRCFPPDYLDGALAESALCRELEGHTLAIVDSYRAAAPRTDENDSQARIPLDMLARVSERTGCTILVLHHARKTPTTGQAASSAKMAVRGSGALFDACQSVLVLEGGETGLDPSTVEQVKARITGGSMRPQTLTAEDHRCPASDAPRWGLTLTAEDSEDSAEAAAQASMDALCDTVLAAVRQHPRSSSGTLVEVTRKGRNRVLAALDILTQGGAIRDIGTGKPRQPKVWVAL